MAVMAAVLDVDGTLVDSNYEHVRAWYQAFIDHDITIPEAWIHRSVGMGGDKLVPHLLHCSEDDPRIKPLSKAHDAVFRQQYFQGIRPLPDASAFVRRLKQSGMKVGIATSANPDEPEHYIALLGIADLLDATVSKGDVEQTKPEPEIFSVACDKLDVSPQRAIAVGDSVWDGESARRLGMPFVGLCTGGFDERELREAGAIAVYKDLPSLLQAWDQSPFATHQDATDTVYEESRH